MWKGARPRRSRSNWSARKLRCVRILPTRASNCAGTWREGDADMRKHPSEANLALFAGGELNRWTRWNIERHVAVCDECRRDISDFSDLRTESTVLADLPEVAWDSMAGEMKANIRLGLEAGE